ncbi:MAG: hypothetical protein A2Y64_03810 [Candidatus Coatesbacteria bacterium RBG_13_66_14]|uniref:Uncharacterized protein n=1 Tax=Candidatus Coatesbacteria bacterium RBG_13_66_14 TaxID=1817816 RepID=A0A1F5F742_9BACT|nr:MAG: hypothetical protein A2Y64_03810 [Candidatus Coatesbacteria bacterium RBG_13_66_14]
MPRVPLAIALLTLLAAACDSDHPASLREAYFAYLDARSAGGDTGAALEGLGWTVGELESAVEHLRSEDPEGFRALMDAYRASRGLPKGD